ncbi:hypothetical protein MMC18_001698 [Xylographa bjoerkii]|nr:hypothetical protein [Xylographa bjoerkii]
MDGFGTPPAKKARLDLQASGITALVPSPIDNMDNFYNSPSPTRGNPLTIEKRSEKIIGSLEVDTSKPIFRLPGLDQSPSMACGDYATNISTEKLSSKLQASKNGYPAQEITLLPPENTGGEAAGFSETQGVQCHETTPDMIDTAVGMNILKRGIGRVEPSRGSRLLKDVEEFTHKIDDTLEVVDTVDSKEADTRHTRLSPPLRKTFGMSALSIIRQHSLDPAIGVADSSNSLNEDRRQPLPSRKTSNGTVAGDTNFKDDIKAKKDALMQADKLKTDFQIASSAKADDGSVLSEEPKITDSNLLFSWESSMPEATFATAMPEDVHGISATSLDVNLKVPDIAEAEFELDSSPIESSSDSSSEASSDDSSDNDYEMLDPAEQARRLMQEDGGSEDEGEKKGTSNGPLRTLNEKPDEVVEKPNVTVTSDMKIEELGNVETMVENLVLVKAKTTGEYKVLETGSVLCLQDRTVIGVVAETLGRVQQPLYSVRFTNATAIEQAGISKGTHIYYTAQHSTYVFTQTLKAFKGSDASNIHDEEVGDDELEFSDDEAETEYKRNLKLHRQARRGGRGNASTGFARPLRPNGVGYTPRKDELEVRKSEDVSISYDEISVDDDLYTPLARPLNLHEQMHQGETSSTSQRGNRNNGVHGGRSWGDFNRSRGGRRGGSRGRGGEQYRRGGPNASSARQQPSNPELDLSLPPTPPATRPPYYPMAPPQPPLPLSLPHSTAPSYSSSQPYQYHGCGTGESFGQHHGSTFNGQASYNYPLQPHSPDYQAPHQRYPQHGQFPQHHNPSQPMNPYRRPSPSYAYGPVSSSYSAPQLPPGAFVNPAFFGNNYQQQADQQHFAPSYEDYPLPHNSFSNGER